jgi:hypothetical protein
MKIIGMAGSDVIAQLSEADMAALVGEGYFSQAEAQKKLEALGIVSTPQWGQPSRIRIGSTIDLAGRFDRIKSIEYRHAELQDVAKKLDAMAALLRHLGDQVIVPPADAT